MAFNMNYNAKDTFGIPLPPTFLGSYEVSIYYLAIKEELLGNV
jgi:hypothetical protein